MTYSQISRNSGNSSDMFYLEQQMKAVKKEMKRAEAAGLQELQDQLSHRLAELEAELDKLED
ncbi:hypothetical protein [Paenibacillus graminis]|uniref:Uncharacterized protein n=1 Tax=Paenibacillus graminis TaxID=189425 RepID=A0A089M6T2_9BACL|nr:hypothetical protein [Paenibacillus graminis]AIQ67228.1 hypothetical protein PGRAT_05945 [Paenibacillus graminis]MEC0170560.1 hypothetical protein [Paenibacillus graminis]